MSLNTIANARYVAAGIAAIDGVVNSDVLKEQYTPAKKLTGSQISSVFRHPIFISTGTKVKSERPAARGRKISTYVLNV